MTGMAAGRTASIRRPYCDSHCWASQVWHPILVQGVSGSDSHRNVCATGTNDSGDPLLERVQAAGGASFVEQKERAWFEFEKLDEL